jgi:hypothetical protein
MRIVVVLFAFLYAQCVFAGPAEDTKAKKKDKFEITLKELTPLATKGDADPFVVHFDVNRVEIDNNQIRVINKIRKETLKAIW